VNRFAGRGKPFKELMVECDQGTTDVADHYQTAQAGAVHEIKTYQLAPMFALGVGDRSVAISGKINEVTRAREAEEIDCLCPSGPFADVRKALSINEDVQHARFARVGSSRERHLRATVGRQLGWAVNRPVEFGVGE
jgi:hypothetical protein